MKEFFKEFGNKFANLGHYLAIALCILVLLWVSKWQQLPLPLVAEIGGLKLQFQHTSNEIATRVQKIESSGYDQRILALENVMKSFEKPGKNQPVSKPSVLPLATTASSAEQGSISSLNNVFNILKDQPPGTNEPSEGAIWIGNSSPLLKTNLVSQDGKQITDFKQIKIGQELISSDALVLRSDYPVSPEKGYYFVRTKVNVVRPGDRIRVIGEPKPYSINGVTQYWLKVSKLS